MAPRLVWAKNLDTLRFSYRRIVVRYKSLTVWLKKTLLGKEIFKNSKKKESLSKGMLSSHEWCKNSAWRRAASHRNGDDDDGYSPSWCSTEAGRSALQYGQVGHNFLSFCVRNHCVKHSLCIDFLQHGVFWSCGHALVQIAHSWSSIT